MLDPRANLRHHAGMSTEIERRFLLKDRTWRPNGIRPVILDQGRYFFGEDASGVVVFFLGIPQFRLLPLTHTRDQTKPLVTIPLSVADGWALAPQCLNFRPALGGCKADLPTGWMARVRSYNDQRYVMDIKGPRIKTTRAEFGEYALPPDTGRTLLTNTPPASRLRKLRYTIPVGEYEWVLDIYQGRNQTHEPTVEVELPSADTPVVIPDWVGEEITNRKTFGGKPPKDPDNKKPAERAE